MWDKQYDSARWNGNNFHILKTDREFGKRVQVSEIPYADEPHTEVLGSKSRTIKLEAVFVGQNSLAESNAFIDALELNPVGQLEHPYLGELDLIYQSASPSFSTKKGLVTVALEFVRLGIVVALPETEVLAIDALVAPVYEASAKQFAKDIEAATPEEVVEVKTRSEHLLSKIRSIVDQISSSASDLSSLHREISASINAIQSISINPFGFALSAIGLSRNVLAIVKQINSTIPATHPANSRTFSMTAYRKMLREQAQTQIKLWISLGMVELSPALESVSAADNIRLLDGEMNIESAGRELRLLASTIEDRETEATSSATYESLELVDSIGSVKSAIIKQSQKIDDIESQVIDVNIAKPVSLLSLSKRYRCQIKHLENLNTIQNPAFVTGRLKVLPNV